MIVVEGEKRKEKSEKWKGIKNVSLPICLEIGSGWEKEKRRILGLQRGGKWKEKIYIFYFLCHNEVERERGMKVHGQKYNFIYTFSLKCFSNSVNFGG